MIVAFNALAWGFEHVPFDSALIASLALAFPHEPIHFFAERGHLDQTQQFLDAHRGRAEVVWRALSLPPRLAAPHERAVADMRLCGTMLVEARRLGAKRVIACYLHAITGTFALKAASFFVPDCRISLVHHGSLLKLVANRRYQPLLAFGNRHLRQIVLGDSIRDEVVKLVPRARTSLCVVRHPYFFDDTTAPSELPAAGPLVFSFLGVADEMKGFPVFSELADTFAPPASQTAHFDLVGGARAGPVPNGGPWVHTYTRAGPMPRDLYEARLRATTYAVFPYDPAFYSLIASGSVLDALAAGKPIIALKNSQFEETFRALGDIGYLCDDVPGMKAVIADLVRAPPRERYRRQSETILAGRRAFDPAAIAVQLREVLAC